MDNTQKLIDKGLVHKSSDENVLIYDIRREIPHFIEEAVYKSIYKSLDPHSRGLLDSCYISISSKKISFLESDAKNYYMLRSIVLEIDSEEADRMADTLEVQDQAFILLLYEPVCCTTKLRLYRDVSEEEEQHILRLMGLGKLKIPNETRYTLSLLFEEFEELKKSPVVYTKMNVDVNHDFFFEHSNDHVPGFMLIEAFRQFCVAVTHVVGSVPQSDAQLVLESLNSKFYKYAELSLPIILKGYIRSCRQNKRGYWSYLYFESDIIQNGTIVAHFQIDGKIISKGVFNRLRRIESEKLQRRYRYTLIKDIAYRFEIVDREYQRSIAVDVVNFSIDGFMLETDYFSNEHYKTHYEFFFFFENIGFIRGTCQMRWLSDDQKRAGMMITEIDNMSMNRLKNVLLRCCTVYHRNELSVYDL